MNETAHGHWLDGSHACEAGEHFVLGVVGGQLGEHVVSEPTDHRLPRLPLTSPAALLRLDGEDRVEDAARRHALVTTTGSGHSKQ